MTQRKTDKALVAISANGEIGYIVDWYGESIEHELDYDLCITSHPMYPYPTEPGLHVWEGEIILVDDADDDYPQDQWNGFWRNPTSEEVNRYLSGLKTWID